MRAGSLITILIFLFVAWGHTVQAYTLVIDPGHGGKDPGAVGKRSYEKNLNLTLAKKVGEKISSQYADVKVVYTRSDDTFVPLQQRADIANSNHADLFLSIHTNSSESKEPKGLETFILGTDKMEKNLDVAMRENAVMMLESDYKTRYQGFDPNSIDSYIMFELMQNSYLDQSLQFATLVQQECVKRLQRYDRGVRQAAFWVLLKTACPSILFEMGFVSSPEEERVLLQDDEMDKMAQAIADAFGAYTRKHKQVAKEVQKKAMQKESVQNGKQVRKDVPPKTTYYAVQIFASQKPLELTAPQFKGQKCKYIRVSGWYKYYTAEDTDRAKVEEKMQKLKVLFPDCWIITFQK
jgi:N-acetylmuramoyl-L-alanine amidase